MKLKIAIYIMCACCLSGCDLVEADKIENPNVENTDFEQSADAMALWVNGAKRNFAQEVGEYCELLEVLTDNYYNNYTYGTKDFDAPKLINSDDDVIRLQRYVGAMRESADYGLQVLATKPDVHATQEELFTLAYIRAYSFVLAGENFRALPVKDAGRVEEWEHHLAHAIVALDKAASHAESADDRAFVATLKARVYRDLGRADSARICAEEAIKLSPEMLRQVTFDGANGVKNALQDFVWTTRYQPLPRLDFLDPKYFMLTDNEQRPIAIAKAEENHLILAEAAIAEGRLGDARSALRSALGVVQKRPTQQLVDKAEQRYNGGYKHYPDDAAYKVRASADAPYRSGLVLSRKAPQVITVPTVSGTSVTAGMVDDAQSADELLYLVYLMRQEVFFGEARRSADLGIRLPMADVEINANASAAAYATPFIPRFIPLNGGMDDFTLDAEQHTVTIAHDMNRVIVENRRDKAIAPFFK